MHAGHVNELVHRVNSSLNLERQAVHRTLEQLGAVEQQLRDEKLILNREKADLHKEQKALEEERQTFEKEVKDEWVLPEDNRRVVLNVGGQRFETTSNVLCRDRFSLLAAICSKWCTTPQDSEGVYFIDRDWWIFRHVLAFLRTKTLPNSPTLLRELYVESAAYRLGSLRAAIERRFAARRSPRRMTAAMLERRDRVVQQASVLASSQRVGNDVGGRNPLQTIAAANDALAWMEPGMGDARAMAEAAAGAGVEAYPGAGEAGIDRTLGAYGRGSTYYGMGGLQPSGAFAATNYSQQYGGTQRRGAGMFPMGSGLFNSSLSAGHMRGAGYGAAGGVGMGMGMGVGVGMGGGGAPMGMGYGGYDAGYNSFATPRNARALPDPFQFTSRGGRLPGAGGMADAAASALPDPMGFTARNGYGYSAYGDDYGNAY